jgi:hypothetical protein
MFRIALVLFTLLCFTGCTTLPAIDAQPATIEQPSPPADGGELQQSDTPQPEGDGTNVWITLGVVALLAVVVIAASGGGGGSGY